jgi:hypothetical protein
MVGGTTGRVSSYVRRKDWKKVYLAPAILTWVRPFTAGADTQRGTPDCDRVKRDVVYRTRNKWMARPTVLGHLITFATIKISSVAPAAIRARSVRQRAPTWPWTVRAARRGVVSDQTGTRRDRWRRNPRRPQMGADL